MKKYTYIFVIILSTGLFANAQSKSIKRADRLFSKFEFVKAAEEYEKLIADGAGDPFDFHPAN